MSSAKRTAEHLDAAQPRAKRIHPFFTGEPRTAPLPPPGPFRWLEPLGPARSCLHGISPHPAPSAKVAAFDLDGTLIKSDYGSAGTREPGKWEWWRNRVPARLKEVVSAGYALVIVSNQALKPQALKAWKAKIPLIAAALPDVPFVLFAATAKDGYRKPMLGMWNELVRMYREAGVEIDRAQSFFVGDAAGRQYTANKRDFASTDRKWALNVGIPFFTPEEYFLKLAPHANYTLPGFNVSSLPSDCPSIRLSRRPPAAHAPPTVPPILPTSTPLLPDPPAQELVVFVGYPCLGKSTFYRRHFEPAGCVKETKKVLAEGKSCVIDNTNRNVATRRFYLDIAKEMNVPARCFYFTGSIELAWHNNLYRAYNLPPSVAAAEPKRELVPYLGFTGFRDNFEEPEEQEGFTEIKKINWVFDGSEEEKAYWSMWLQIDGK
ncbi:hypothetical protein C0993_008063 [Termitomyces sp. T159_Od127]|nr:hypothetical protein C0993_008063 [Termitomyces sp. T159_Od127]